jgi:hypothetical protein
MVSSLAACTGALAALVIAAAAIGAAIFVVMR